jgi:hypothetical protein
MKTFFLTAVAIACAFGPVRSTLAQTKGSSTGAASVTKVALPGPAIQFDATTFNFGKIKSGELVKHEFVFTNTGSATLEITDVRPGCGCTTAGTWDKRVAPGKTGVVPLQFNSGAYGGTVTKPTTVTCNDPAQSNIVLQLTGTIWKPIDVAPSMAIFNYSDEQQTNQTKVVLIVNNMDEPLALSDLQCTNAAFRAQLKTVRPGKEFELQITALPPFLAPYLLAPVTLKSSASQMPLINVSAYVMVQKTVSVIPEQITLPAGPLPSAFKTSVSVRNTSTNSLKLSEAKLSIAGAEVRIDEVQPGKFFTISLNFPAGAQVKPGERAELTIKSNHSKFPLLTASIFQPQPPQAASVVPSISPVTRVVVPGVAAGK